MINVGPPKPAPFPTGTKLEYLGRPTGVIHSHSHPDAAGNHKRWCAQTAGLVCEVVDEADGYQGTGRMIDDGADDDGEPTFDETRDSLSVVRWPCGHITCINHSSANEWKIIAKPSL